VTTIRLIPLYQDWRLSSWGTKGNRCSGVFQFSLCFTFHQVQNSHNKTKKINLNAMQFNCIFHTNHADQKCVNNI